MLILTKKSPVVKNEKRREKILKKVVDLNFI